MEPRINIITLGVKDLRRAVRFYQEGLGWKRSSAGGDEIAFFHTRGVVLALFPREDLAADAKLPPGRGNAGFPGFTLAHNVASKGEVDSVLAKAHSAGATNPQARSRPPVGRLLRIFCRSRRLRVGGGVESAIPHERRRESALARVGNLAGGGGRDSGDSCNVLHSRSR